jgi:hypothetical protein
MPKHEVAHNDGVPSNNAASNLRWDTRAGNFSDKIRHGTHSRGERSPNATLTNAQVLDMKRRLAAGNSLREIADHFRISYRNAWQIKNGRRWRHITI